MRNAIRTLIPLLGMLLTLVVVAAASADDGVGVVDERTGEWYLRDPSNGDTTRFYYGNPGDSPFVGDWDCDGVETPGLYRQRDGFVYLRNSNTQGIADLRFFFGNPGDVPLAGDWNGDGCDTVSLYRPSQGRFYVINKLGSEDAGLGAAELSYTFGNPGDTPFSGDFDGDGVHTFGVTRGDGVFLSNTHADGSAALGFDFGASGQDVVAGAWAGGSDTIGRYIPSAGIFSLRHSNSAGPADAEIEYGNSHTAPVAGAFGSLPGGDEAPKRPPPYPDVGSGKRIIYCNSCQRIWLIDANDQLVDTYLVTGKEGIPPPGTYDVWSKSVSAYAPYGGITMKHMVRFVRPYSIIKPDGRINQWSYGFHSVPIYRDGTPLHTVFGTFGSGGCVRQPNELAAALYDWTPIGTPVHVIP